MVSRSIQSPTYCLRSMELGGPSFRTRGRIFYALFRHGPNPSRGRPGQEAGRKIHPVIVWVAVIVPFREAWAS